MTKLMSIFREARWIQDVRFSDFDPIDMGHKETAPFRHEHPDHLRNQHTFYRRTLRLSEVPKHALLFITADDYYKLYVNGRYLAQGPAQGYPEHYYYNEIDIACFLQPGRNVIAVHVYYQGLVNRVFNSGDLRQGLMAELYADDKLLLCTDKSWKHSHTDEFGQGDITGYNTQFLENIDSRLVQHGWKTTEFDDTAWTPPIERGSEGYRFLLQPTPFLSVYNVHPSTVRKVAPGHFVIDFGSEITGQFTMKACGMSGQTIEIRCGEELTNDGESVRNEMRCNCAYREMWTLSGTDDVLDFFDYKAFRYVEVIGPEETLIPDSFSAIVRHYPLDETKCTFESSDLLLNRIWSICKDGVKYGSQETYVDCPSREKGQYLGDNTIITHAHAYLSGDLRLYRKSLQDFAASSSICPGLMAVAPGNLMQEIADYSLQWPAQLWRYYEFSGDIEFLKSMVPSLERLLVHFRQYEDADGLLSNVLDKWNLVDWPENLTDDYDFPLTRPVSEGCHNVLNSFYYGCLETAQSITRELGVLTPEPDRLDRFRDAFCRRFYDVSTRLFVDRAGSKHSSLHANVLPLLFGLAPEDAVAAIVDLVRVKGLNCGVYMAYFVLKALARANEYELLFELLTNEGPHSWANMLREGATTCFEAWGKEQKWNTSLCHAWASAPIPILIEDIFGLKPGLPGWRQVQFHPHFPASLKYANLTVTLPTGKVSVSYRIRQETDLVYERGTNP